MSRQRLQRVDHVEMARVERPVLRLADRSARGVELVEALRQLHEVLEVGHLRVAADVALADEGAAVDGRERHVVAADVMLCAGLRACSSNCARRLGDLLEDEIGIELDAVLADDV